jgi:hypothetical protein
LPGLAGDRVAGRGLAFSRMDSATLSFSVSTAVNRANPRPRFFAGEPGLGMTAVLGQKRKAWEFAQSQRTATEAVAQQTQPGPAKSVTLALLTGWMGQSATNDGLQPLKSQREQQAHATARLPVS